MNKKTSSILLVAWMATALSGIAATHSYPENDPICTMEIPDAWKVATENKILQASPADESVYLGFWSVDAADTEKALKSLDKELEKQMSDLELGDAKELEINGIPFVFIDGTGKTKDDGTKVSFSAAVFVPAKGKVMVLNYFGTPEAEAKHEAALAKIVQSIAPAGAKEKTVSYPAKSPVFTLKVSDSWKVGIENNVLQAIPKDESIYLGIWGVEADSTEKALEGLDKELEKLITAEESDDAQEMEINGIPFVFVEGKGKTKDDGTKVTFSAAVFVPAKDKVMVLFYFGTPEAEAKHEKALTKIVQSITRAGKEE